MRDTYATTNRVCGASAVASRSSASQACADLRRQGQSTRAAVADRHLARRWLSATATEHTAPEDRETIARRACPAGYSQQSTVYPIIETRSCSACACNKFGNCTVDIELHGWGDTTCASASQGTLLGPPRSASTTRRLRRAFAQGQSRASTPRRARQPVGRPARSRSVRPSRFAAMTSLTCTPRSGIPAARGGAGPDAMQRSNGRPVWGRSLERARLADPWRRERRRRARGRTRSPRTAVV
jgi:hypothetical protein